MAENQSTSAARKNRLMRAATLEFANKPDPPQQQAPDKPQQREKLKERQPRQAKETPRSPPSSSETPNRKTSPPARSGSQTGSRSSVGGAGVSFTPLLYTSDDDSDTPSDFADIMIGRHHHRHSQHIEEESLPEFWTKAPWFKNLVAGIIVANTIVMVVEAFLIQLQSHVFTCFDWIFTFLYVCELGCCVAEQGIKNFLNEDDWWNTFDLCVTVSCVVDLVVTTVSGASVTRLFRLFRILRMCRGLRFLNELDYVLIQIARATLKLGFLASIMLFVSSMVATNMLWDCADPVVAGMFENLGKSLWTMFKIMTMDNWIATVDIVLEVKPEMLWFFIIFIFSTAISLISLAPAMFIDISLKQMEHEDFKQQELARSELRAQKKKILSTLFKLTDMDNSGSISIDELKTVLCNDSFVNELEKRGISRADDLRDVRLGLFDLWEERSNIAKGHYDDITMEEFTDGLLRMHEGFSQAVLWRSITSTRLLLRDFAAVVLDELADMKLEMSSHVNQAVAGLLQSCAQSSGDLSQALSSATPLRSQDPDESLQGPPSTQKRVRLQRSSTQIFTRRTTLEKHIGLRAPNPLRDGDLKSKNATQKKDGTSEESGDSSSQESLPINRKHSEETRTRRLTQRLDTLIRRREVPITPSPTFENYPSEGSGIGRFPSEGSGNVRDSCTISPQTSIRSSGAFADRTPSRDLRLQYSENGMNLQTPTQNGMKCKL